MNKHCFRLIFSKTLGFLIPVAEITRAQRKPGQTACSALPVPSPSSVFSLKNLAASMLLAGVSGYAFAQLIVDPSAGETNVNTAPNGVPVIEITNPNGNGLSHNRFTEFDVQKPGVIFNNSQVNGQSQLGGTILRNPHLQNQATAILSEVTGNKPSSISGTLEVFGGRADILIAKAKVGESKLNSYSFNLPNKNAIISGFGEGHGNATTLLNDADNPVDNNVAHIWLGKNLVFIVAKRPIKQGSQLLLDYGGTYDRSGWESHPIKVEDDAPTASNP